MGARLYRSRAARTTARVDPDREAKSVSAETTFDEDIADFRPLELVGSGGCPKKSRRG